MEIQTKSWFPGSGAVANNRRKDYMRNGTFSTARSTFALNKDLPEPFSLAGKPLSDVFPIEFVDGRYKMRDDWDREESPEMAMANLDPFRLASRAQINIDNIVVDDIEALTIGDSGDYEVTMKCNFVSGTFTTSYYPLKSFLHCMYVLLHMERFTGVDVSSLNLASAEAIADTLLLQTIFRPFKDTMSKEVKLDVNTVLRLVMHFIYYYHNYETTDVCYDLVKANSAATSTLSVGTHRTSTGIRVNDVDVKIRSQHKQVIRDKLTEAGVNPDVYHLLKAPILGLTGVLDDPNATENPYLRGGSSAQISSDYVTFDNLLAANNLPIKRRDIRIIYDQWCDNSITNQLDVSLKGEGDSAIKVKGEIGSGVESQNNVFTSYANITKVSEITNWDYAPTIIIVNGHWIMAGNDDDPFYYSWTANGNAYIVCDEESKEVHVRGWSFVVGSEDDHLNYVMAVIPHSTFDYQVLINKYRNCVGDGLLRAMLSTELKDKHIKDILDMANEGDFSEIDPLILKQVITEQNNYKMSITSLISIGIREFINVVSQTDEYNGYDAEEYYYALRRTLIPVDSIIYQRHLEKWTDDLYDSTTISLPLWCVLERYVYPTTAYFKEHGEDGSFHEWLQNLLVETLRPIDEEVPDPEETPYSDNVRELVTEADAEYISTLAASFSDALENVVDDYVASVPKENLNASEVQSLLNQQAEAFMSSIDSDVVTSVIDAINNDDQGVSDLFKRVRDACSTKSASIAATIPSYIEGYKSGEIFNSYTVQRFLEKATKISNPLELVYNSNNSKAATDLGWSSNSMYSDASKLDLAIGAIPGDTIVAGCVVAAKAVGKAVSWLGKKVRDFVGSTIKDGVSFKVQAAGYSTLNVQAVTQLFSTEEFAYLYPNLYRVVNMQQGLVDSHYCVCQFGPMYAFIQTVGNTIMVTCNPKIDRKTEDQSMSGNDYKFIYQVAESIRTNQLFHNSLLDYLVKEDILNDTYKQLLAVKVDSIESLMRDVENRASAISRSSAIAKKSAWAILGIAAGALLCCTGYGSVAGVAIIAACTGAAIACSDPVPEADLTAIERLRDDDVYANDLIKANDFVNLLQNGVSYTQMSFLLQSLNILSNFNLKGDPSSCFSLVHNGTGYIYGDMESYLDNDEIPLGFIPLVTMAGAPAFKYVLVTDAERRTSFLTGVAVIGAIAVAAIGTFAGATIKKARIKKYDALNANLWTNGAKPTSKEYKDALKKCRKARKLENKLTGATGGSSPFNVMSLINAEETKETNDKTLTIDDMTEVATKTDVSSIDFSTKLSETIDRVTGGKATRSITDGVAWLITALITMITGQSSIEEKIDGIKQDEGPQFWNPGGGVK